MSPRGVEGRNVAARQTCRVSHTTKHQVCVVTVAKADTTRSAKLPFF